jgi:Holliday junction DNA helicase RuvA
MIAHLHGRVIERQVEAQAESIVLEVAGVGYAVATSAATMRAIQHVGAEVSLWIHSHHTQDAGPALYGFLERDERGLFETLLGVQGVGPKVALAMLSGLPRAELTQAIAGADIARLMQIRGVGRKTAERLAVELRDKLVPFPVAPAPGAGRPGGAVAGGAPGESALPERLQEAQGALVALGYRLPELEPVIARMDPELPIADLIKQGLAALRRV